jgi:hypothetical protein
MSAVPASISRPDLVASGMSLTTVIAFKSHDEAPKLV